MPRPTKLLPGQKVTVEAFNREIDRTRKQLSSVVGSTLQSGTTGGGVGVTRDLQPLWGRLVAFGPERSPNYYQWEEVYPDKDGDILTKDISSDAYWVARTGDADTELAPHDSIIAKDSEDEEWLINPAVEVNDRKPPLGVVVRLTPTENFVEQGKPLVDERDDYWMHRHWLFIWDEHLRPIVLTEDLIPAQAETGNPFPLQTAFTAARFLDTGEAVTIFPAHPRGWPLFDFISQGFGRAESTYFRGTFGWVRYDPKGTQIDVDENGPVL